MQFLIIYSIKRHLTLKFGVLTGSVFSRGFAATLRHTIPVSSAPWQNELAREVEHLDT